MTTIYLFFESYTLQYNAIMKKQVMGRTYEKEMECEWLHVN